MVEGNGSEKICQRNVERPCHIAKSFLRKETISIMEGMKQGKKRCRLVTPTFHQFPVCWNCHRSLRSGKK